MLTITRDRVLYLVLVLVVGSINCFLKFAVHVVTPGFLFLCHGLIALPMLLGLMIRAGGREMTAPSTDKLTAMVTFGLLQVVIPLYCFFFANTVLQSVICSILFSVVPLMIMFVQSSTGGAKRPSYMTVWGVCCCLVGIILCIAANRKVQQDHNDTDGNFPEAYGFIALGVISWALGSVLWDRYLQEEATPLQTGVVVNLVMIAVSLFLVFVWDYSFPLTTDEHALHYLPHSRTKAAFWLALLFFGFVFGVVGFVAHGQLCKSCGSYVVSRAMFMVSIVGTAEGIFVHGEYEVSWSFVATLVGLVLVVCGLACADLHPKLPAGNLSLEDSVNESHRSISIGDAFQLDQELWKDKELSLLGSVEEPQGDLNIRRATIFFRSALHKREPPKITEDNISWHEVRLGSLRRNIKIVVLTLHLALALFERPATFEGIAKHALAAVEMICVSFYAWEVHLVNKCKGNTYGLWTRLKLVLVVMTFADILIQLVTSFKVWHFMRIIRPIFVLEESANLRLLAESVVKTLGAVLEVLFLQLLLVVVFGTIAYVIERNDDFGEPFIPDMSCQSLPTAMLNLTNGAPGWPWQDYCIVQDTTCAKFTVLFDSITRFFVLMTTANYPDVMMCLYDTSRFYVLLFVTFLCCTVFLMNLLVAVVFTSYRARTKLLTLSSLRRITVSLNHAFDELAEPYPNDPETKAIRLCTWVKLSKKLFRRKNRQQATFEFFLMDRDNNGWIGREDMMMAYDIFHLKIRKHRMASRTTWWLQTLREITLPVVKHAGFDFLVSTIVVGNLLILLVVTEGNRKPLLEEFLDHVFPIMFAVEILFKLLVFGIAPFFDSGWNIFDFIITTCGVVLYVLAVSSVEVPSKVANAALSIRVFRVFRLLNFSHRFRRIFTTATDVVPTLLSFVVLLLCMYYSFAIAGMDLFAHTVIEQNCYCIGCPDRMWLNTFNHLVTSMITLFELMIVNNWQYNMDMHVNATRTRVTRIFFIVYYILTALVMMNLVVAFILEAFVQRWELRSEPTDSERKVLHGAGGAVSSRRGLEPYWFEIVKHRAGLTSVLFDFHKDELMQVANGSVDFCSAQARVRRQEDGAADQWEELLMVSGFKARQSIRTPAPTDILQLESFVVSRTVTKLADKLAPRKNSKESASTEQASARSSKATMRSAVIADPPKRAKAQTGGQESRNAASTSSEVATSQVVGEADDDKNTAGVNASDDVGASDGADN